MRNCVRATAILAGLMLTAHPVRAGEARPTGAATAPTMRPAGRPMIVVDIFHPSVEKMLTDIDARSEKIKDLQGDLVRTKVSYAWGDKQVRKGTLKYRRPDLWHVDLGTGKYREIWIGTGKAVYQVKFGLEQIIEHEVPEEQGRGALKHGPIAFLLGQKAEETRKRYRLELVKEDANEVTVRAIPRPGLAVGFTKAELTVQRKTALPVGVHMWERTRDELIFEFRNVRENKGVALSVFHKPRVPDGWQFIKKPMPQPQPPAPTGPPKPGDRLPVRPK